MSYIQLNLYRNGVLVRTITETMAPLTVVVQVKEEPQGIDPRTMFRSLPAKVLCDRFNSKYDHYFPDKEISRDVYVVVGRDGNNYRYEYDRTETMTIKDRYP